MKITANMATVPARTKTAITVIESLYHQVSLIRLYLNNFTDIPKEFIDEKIHVFQGEDLQSSGKVFWAMNPSEYYFCVDDDILYPKDYVKYSLEKLAQYNDDVIISFHGRKFARGKKISNYFKDQISYLHFKHLNLHDTLVDVIGNGVSCWNTNNIKIDVTKFPYHYMDDILVSAQALEQGKKRIVVAHKAGYLKALETENLSLFGKYKDSSKVQTEVFNSIDWS